MSRGRSLQRVATGSDHRDKLLTRQPSGKAARCCGGEVPGAEVSRWRGKQASTGQVVREINLLGLTPSGIASRRKVWLCVTVIPMETVTE